MNRKVYLMDLHPSPNHIFPKQGHLENFRTIAPEIWEEIANRH